MPAQRQPTPKTDKRLTAQSTKAVPTQGTHIPTPAGPFSTPSMLAVSAAAAHALAPHPPDDMDAYDPLFDEEFVNEDVADSDDDLFSFDCGEDDDDDEAPKSSHASRDSLRQGLPPPHRRESSDSSDVQVYSAVIPSTLMPLYTADEMDAYDDYLGAVKLLPAYTADAEAIGALLPSRLVTRFEALHVDDAIPWDGVEQFLEGNRWDMDDPNDEDRAGNRDYCCARNMRAPEPPSRRIMPTGCQVITWYTEDKRHVECNDDHELLRMQLWLSDDRRMRESGVLKRLEFTCLPSNWDNGTSSTTITDVDKGSGGGVKAALASLQQMIKDCPPWRQMNGKCYIRYVLPLYRNITAQLGRRVVEADTALSAADRRRRPISGLYSAMSDDELMKETLVLLVLFRLQCTTPQWARYHVERYCDQFGLFERTEATATPSVEEPSVAIGGLGKKRNRFDCTGTAREIKCDTQAIAANFSVFLRVLHDELATDLLRDERLLEGELEKAIREERREVADRDVTGAASTVSSGESEDGNGDPAASPSLPLSLRQLVNGAMKSTPEPTRWGKKGGPNEATIMALNQQIRDVRANVAHLHRVTLLYYGAKCCCEALKRYRRDYLGTMPNSMATPDTTTEAHHPTNLRVTVKSEVSADGETAQRLGANGHGSHQSPILNGPYAPCNATCFAHHRRLADFEQYFA